MDEVQIIEKEQLSEEEIKKIEEDMKKAAEEQIQKHKSLFIWIPNTINDEEKDFIRTQIEEKEVTEIIMIKNSEVEKFINTDEYKFMDKSFLYVLEDYPEIEQAKAASNTADYVLVTDEQDLSMLDAYQDKFIILRR